MILHENHSQLGNHNNSESGVLLSNLKLRYCKYDSQKLGLEETAERVNGSIHVLLVYGDMIPSLSY